MVLDSTDGAPRRLLDLGDGERNLLFILCLPLLDGVFATLLVTGALQTFSDIVAVALTVFTGAGALAVLYSYSESCSEARSMVLSVSPYLVAGALAVSLVAPVFSEILYVSRLQYAAGLALLIVAGKLSGISAAESLSVPAVMLTGVLLSLKSPSQLYLSYSYVIPALATSLVAVLSLYAASYLPSGKLSLRYIRIGGSLVVALIGLTMFGISLPSELGIAVFAASVIAALRS